MANRIRINKLTLCLTNSKSKTGICFTLTTSSICKISMLWISTKPFNANASQHRWDCSMHGENEQNLPPSKRKLVKKHFFFVTEIVDYLLPESFNAFNACGTATWGAGRSKNTASAQPFSSSVNPSSQTSRWHTYFEFRRIIFWFVFE